MRTIWRYSLLATYALLAVLALDLMDIARSLIQGEITITPTIEIKSMPKGVLLVVTVNAYNPTYHVIDLNIELSCAFGSNSTRARLSPLGGRTLLQVSLLVPYNVTEIPKFKISMILRFDGLYVFKIERKIP